MTAMTYTSPLLPLMAYQNPTWNTIVRQFHETSSTTIYNFQINLNVILLFLYRSPDFKSSTWFPHHISVHIVLKVKVTLIQTLRLCTGRTAHRGSRGIALL